LTTETTTQMRRAVTDEATATAYGITTRVARRKTIPLREIADDVTTAVEFRAERLFTASGLGQRACRDGCAYCCYVPRVLVTLPELARIAEAVATWPADQIVALRARLEAHAAAEASGTAAPSLGPPCALLVDGRCSVYDVRPLVCRGQHAYDVRECQAHYESGTSLTLQLTLVLDAVQGAVDGVASALHEVGLRPTLFSLSRALLLALENPKAISLAAAGLASLASATPDLRLERRFLRAEERATF
jgi:Fe-S-cluster containining protein